MGKLYTQMPGIASGSPGALQDLPESALHVVGRAEAAIALKVKGDALEQVAVIRDAKAAPLEYLEFIVQALDKAAVLVVVEVIRNPVEPGVQQLQEAIKAGEPTGTYRPLPLLEPAYSGRF